MDLYREKQILSKVKIMDSIAEKHNKICNEIEKKQSELIGKETILNKFLTNEILKILVDSENLQMIAFFNIQKLKFEKEVKELKSSLKILNDSREQKRFEYSICLEQIYIL